MTRRAKHAASRLIFAARLDALFLRAAVVVAFHRVCDGEDRRGLSVSRDMFERHCRFFKRHFDVVPLRELVARIEENRRVDRCLAITFDDGYLDNFVNARPVLEELSLPATFFVVSRWIGSDAWPWWDREHGVRHPWMSWNQVRVLNERGFDIGAHTRTHADLCCLDGLAAREEIDGGRAEIERQIGRPVDLFAYPYGRVENMSESNRALVKAAGFRCCCSCHGGVARGGADPFRLQRIAVTPWYDSPHHFGAAILREAAAPLRLEGGRCSEISAAIGY
jgi:peptidoglycan/xylan/chitin deacetylase (PgdA/CDA1 family)